MRSLPLWFERAGAQLAEVMMKAIMPNTAIENRRNGRGPIAKFQSFFIRCVIFASVFHQNILLRKVSCFMEDCFCY
jgi:hypothetical protein